MYVSSLVGCHFHFLSCIVTRLFLLSLYTLYQITPLFYLPGGSFDFVIFKWCFQGKTSKQEGW